MARLSETAPNVPDGYSSTFLPITVELPDATATDLTVELDYPHFTILFRPDRRLAAATAVNIDGAQLLDLARGDDWHFDARIDESDQAGPDIYARNDLDRGHLVRRRDPVWGTPDVASVANQATFAFTNAAPQAALFNQGPELWSGLEDHVLEYAGAHAHKISVFTGPIFAADDPTYRGLQIPRRFWKIATWVYVDSEDAVDMPRLAAAAFVLDQTEQLEVVLAAERSVAVPPSLGPFLTYQVPVSDVEATTGLEFGGLVAVDVFLRSPHVRENSECIQDWALLASGEEIVIRSLRP